MSKIETNTPVRLADRIVNNGQAEVMEQIAKTHHGEALLISLAEGSVIPEHQVNAVAIANVIDGEVEFIVGDTPHNMKTGDAIILNPHQKHSVKAIKNAKIYLVRINA